MTKLGKKKATVAIGHGLLRVAYAMLRDGKPHREPEASLLRALEREKLVQHHARRLRQLDAHPEEVRPIVERLLAVANVEASKAPDGEARREPEAGEIAGEGEAARPSKRSCKCATSPVSRTATIRRGALGFRVRDRRGQYSVFNELPGGRHSSTNPKSTSKRARQNPPRNHKAGRSEERPPGEPQHSEEGTA